MAIREWFAKQSLRTKLILFYSMLFSFTMIIGGMWILKSVSDDLVKGVEDELSIYTTQTINMIQTTADASVRNHLRTIAETNYEMIRYFYSLYESGVVDEPYAKHRAEELLLAQVIGETGYNYVINSHGDILVHPVKANLGRNVQEYQFIQRQLDVKEGYLEYQWKNPDEEAERNKALYMVYFEPWDWIISVSSYRDEFHKLVDTDIFEMKLNDLKFGESGYTFIIAENGDIVVHPRFSNSSISALDDPENRKVLERIIKQKTGVMKYMWQNPEDENPREKMTFLHYMPNYQWIVGSSIYRDEFYLPVDRLRSQMMMMFVLTIMAVVVLTVVLSRYITRPLEYVVRAFEFGIRGDLTTRLDVKRQDEIGILAKQYNTFVDSLNQKQQELLDEMNERIRGEDKLKTIMQTTNEGFIQIDGNMIIEDANESLCAMIDYAPHEVLGESVGKFLDADNLKILITQLRENRSKNLKSNYELDIKRKNGSYIHCMVNASPIVNEEGVVTGSFGMLTDISELKENILAKEQALRDLQELNSKLETIIDQRTHKLRASLESLKDAQNKLVEAEKMSSLGKLISGIAHEINTPIGNCVTATTYVEKELVSVKERYSLGLMKKREFEDLINVVDDSCRIMNNNLNKASDLITTFKNVTAVSQKSEKETVRIRDVIQHVMDLFEEEFEIEKHELMVTCPDQLQVYSDPNALTQMLMHLLSNASQHGLKNMPGGRIEVIVEDEGPNVRFGISDNGIGLTKEHLEHIFDPFYILKSAQEGVGLGLHIVYNTVVQVLGGSIECMSTPETGTLFIIEIPKNL